MTEKSGLQKTLEDFGYECRNYSGRGMYGKQCLAFVTNDSLLYIGFQLGQVYNGNDIDEYALQSMKSDNMGLSTVYYFPNIPYVENDED